MCWRKITFLTVTTDEDFLIDGAKIFEGIDTGKTCTVFDPEHGERHTADIYEVQGKTKKFKVAIAEFSMCVYGIYLVGDGIKEKTERRPRQKPTTLEKVGYLAIVSSILTLIAVMIACALKSDYFMLLPVPFFLVFVVSVGFFLKMLYKNNRKRYFAKEPNETKVDYRSNDTRPYYDVEEEFDNVIAKNNWETVQKVLSDNGIPIDVYTLNAYIETFGDTDFFGDKDINQIDEWLTKNVDAFEGSLKNAVVDFFVEKNGFTWLKSYCDNVKKKDLGLKKIRFATIRNILDSLSDDSLNYYVEIFDGFGPLDEILDMPASLYGTIEREGIGKAYQVIKNWVETEKEDILKGLGKKVANTSKKKKPKEDISATAIYLDALEGEKEWRKTASQNDLELLDQTIMQLQTIGLTEIQCFSDIKHRKITDKKAIAVLTETILKWDDVGQEAELIGVIGIRGNTNATEKIIHSYERMPDNEKKGCAFYDNALARIADKRYKDVYLRWAKSWKDLSHFALLMDCFSKWGFEEGRDIFLYQLFSKEDYELYDPVNYCNHRNQAYMNALIALSKYTDTDGRIESALKKVIAETDYKYLREAAVRALKKLKKA